MIISHNMLFFIPWDSVVMITINHLGFIILSNYHVCPHHRVIQAEQALGWGFWIPWKSPSLVSRVSRWGWADWNMIGISHERQGLESCLNWHAAQDGSLSFHSIYGYWCGNHRFWRTKADQHAKLLEEGNFSLFILILGLDYSFVYFNSSIEV